MKRKGGAGLAAGLAVMAAGLIAMLLPFCTGADMMAWGFGAVALGLFVFIAGTVTFLLFRHRQKVLNAIADGAEVLARWSYDAADWKKWREEELDGNKGMPVFGAVLGGIFLVIGIVFYASDPDDMAGMFWMMAGIGLIIAFSAWLSTFVRNRSIRSDPGEAVISMRGVWFMGNLTDWNGVTSWFNGAKVEEDGGRPHLVINYRYIAGRYARMRYSQVSVPVPQGRENEANDVARILNRQF